MSARIFSEKTLRFRNGIFSEVDHALVLIRTAERSELYGAFLNRIIAKLPEIA